LHELTLYLQKKGIDTTLNKEPAIDYFGRDTEEAVLQLAGQSLQEIRLYARIYGTGLIIYRFYYDLLFDTKLSPEMCRSIATKVKPVKEDKVIGLFGGKLVGIKWLGRDVAAQLSSDNNLLSRLLDYAGYFDVGQIRIYAESSSRVRVLGPRLVVPVNELNDEAGRKRNREGLIRLLYFEIYESIAQQVRKTLATG